MNLSAKMPKPLVIGGVVVGGDGNAAREDGVKEALSSGHVAWWVEAEYGV